MARIFLLFKGTSSITRLPTRKDRRIRKRMRGASNIYKMRRLSYARMHFGWGSSVINRQGNWREPLSKPPPLRALSVADSTVYKNAWANPIAAPRTRVPYSITTSPLVVEGEWKAWAGENKYTEQENTDGGSKTIFDRFVTNSGKENKNPNLKKEAAPSRLQTLAMRIARRLHDNDNPQLQGCFKVDKNNCLGRGRQGVVYSCIGVAGQHDGVSGAVKTCAKYQKFWKKEDIGSVRREVRILKQLGFHKNLAKVHGVYESPMNIHIVSEVLAGGDLFNYLNAIDFVQQDEEVTRKAVAALLGVVQFCHDKNIVHLDIKLENIMLRRANKGLDPDELVLIDFGHARDMPKEVHPHSSCGFPTGTLRRPVGSPSYTAPEVVLETTYSERSDAWALGVVTYVLLQGYLPFPHLQTKVWKEFRAGDYTSPHTCPFRYEADWEHLSPQAIDFVRKLLEFDPRNRLTVGGALKHPWVLGQVQSKPSKEPFYSKFWS